MKFIREHGIRLIAVAIIGLMTVLFLKATHAGLTGDCKNGNIAACETLCDRGNDLACDRLPDTVPPVTECQTATRGACRGGSQGDCQCLCDAGDLLACDRLPDGGNDTGDTGGSGDYACTQVMGFSQTDQWYEKGDVESFPQINDSEWQLKWQSGGGIEKWALPSYRGWDQPLFSRCGSNSGNPDRIVFQVSSSDRFATSGEIGGWVLSVAGIAANTWSNLEEISFITVISGPGGTICQVPVGRPDAGSDVSATTNHAKYEDGIELAAAATNSHPAGVRVVEGNHPEVGACHWYGDQKGHLQTPYNDDMAERMAEVYLP